MSSMVLGASFLITKVECFVPVNTIPPSSSSSSSFSSSFFLLLSYNIARLTASVVFLAAAARGLAGSLADVLAQEVVGARGVLVDDAADPDDRDSPRLAARRPVPTSMMVAEGEKSHSTPSSSLFFILSFPPFVYVGLTPPRA